MLATSYHVPLQLDLVYLALVKRAAGFLWALLAEGLLLLPLAALSAISRLAPRRVDVGLGPEPLINNVHHARALRKAGWSAETFVSNVYYVTQDFDARPRLGQLPKPLGQSWLFVRALFRYRALFFYLNGGPLAGTRFLRRSEPWLLRIAGIRMVVMPYGSDVQDLTRSKNLAFVNAFAHDYPDQGPRHARVAQQIDRWTRHANWLLSGCEWVDYMYQWDSLLLGHFSIDTTQWRPSVNARRPGPFRVLHAPNHRAIKGTQALLEAIETVRREGLEVELVLLERVPNSEIRAAMEDADLVADQFVIGWYAMFAIEAMSLGKPALCYLRTDLIDLYVKAGLIEPGEIPLVNTVAGGIAERLRWAAAHSAELEEIGRRGRAFVEKHHSLERIGAEFTKILEAIGVEKRPAFSASQASGRRATT